MSKSTIVLLVACLATPGVARLNAQSTSGRQAAANTSSSAASNSFGVPAPDATLRPGDVVRITVWRMPELSGDFEIAADGSIRHPLYREVRVSGLPLGEVEARIRKYVDTYEASPQVVVEPLFRVAVGGEVREPSLYTLPPETTIGQAVAMAGGATERGRLDRVRLLRSDREIRLDLNRPEPSISSMLIRSGDQIIVGRRHAVMRDVIAPVASITAGVASIAAIIIHNQR